MNKETKENAISAIVTVSFVVAIIINMFMSSINPILGLILYFLIIALYIYCCLVFEVAPYTLYLSTKKYYSNHMEENKNEF